MDAKRDCYEVLGVPRTADAGMIKRAYRKKAKQYHPDSNVGNTQAEEHFKEATEAYAILSDPEKRRLYDRYGFSAFDGSGGQDFADGTGSGAGRREYHFTEADMDDILRDIFGDGFGRAGHRSADGFEEGFAGDPAGGCYNGFGYGNADGFHRGFGADPMGDFGGFGRGMNRGKGADLHAEIEISFDEAVSGCDKLIHLTDGAGARKSLKVHIPAGIDTGKTVRLRGKGQPGRGGGPSGDLLIQVRAGSRPGFERKGMDLFTTARIPFSTAVLGGEAVVETLSGRVSCRIHPGTQSGTRIRLKGKGVVSMKNASQRGDQYVTIQIDVPKNLSEEARRKLKEFEEACGRKGQGAA